MKPRTALAFLVVGILAAAPITAAAQQMTFKVLPSPTRATFKTEAPLETVIGNTSGPAITGTVTGDPSKPQMATGSIRVDLTTVKTGIDKRDADMRSKDYLDTDNEANRYAVFELKGVEIGGPLRLQVVLDGLLQHSAEARPALALGRRRLGPGLGRERLDQEVVHAGLKAGAAIILEGVGRQRHDRTGHSQTVAQTIEIGLHRDLQEVAVFIAPGQ
jgi:hypothetical protein